MTKNNFQALQYARAQLFRQYWYGTFGQLGSPQLLEEKRKQYPSMYKKWPEESFEAGFDEKVHDCIGLAVKGYMMSPDPESPARYIEKYDVSADKMIELCKETGSYSSIPEIPGILVWKKGHIGIYEGNGVTIEAKGHAYGVVRTKDTKWKKWGLCPWWEYISITSWLSSLYNDILNRKPDADGIKYWEGELHSSRQTPTAVISFFLTSPELAQRNLSDEDFLVILYRVFFDREPDADGLKYWLNQLKKTSREKVIDGFIYSKEWKDMEDYLLYIL